MAKTFYGYQQRDAESQINWAEVGKNFSDMLSEEARVREEKKAAIDEATREAQRQLNETPQGQSETLNEWALKYAADAQEVMLIQERLLKSGRLKPTDYTVMRQNLVDGTDEAFAVVQSYQDEFARKMQRMNDGDSQKLEQWVMENIEGFGNFNRSKLWVNPETGKVSVAFMDEDGKIPTDPTKLRSLSSLRASIGMDFNKYDLEKSTSDFVNAQGTWQDISRRVGSAGMKGVIEVISDPMNKTLTKEDFERLGITDPLLQESIKESINYYAEAEQDFIDAQLAMPYNGTSILTDYTNAGYTFTFDPNKQGDKTILLVNDSMGRPVPEFTDEQKAEAESVIRNSLRNKISKEVQTTVVSDYTPTPQYLFQRGDDARKQASVMTSVANLYSGNEAEQTEAANFLKSINPNILSIDRKLEGVTLTYKDGSIQEMPFKTDKDLTLSERDWATGSTNYFLPSGSTILDIDETARAAGIRGATIPMAGEVSVRTDVPEKEGFREAFEREVVDTIDKNLFVIEDETKTVEKLTNFIASIDGLKSHKVEEASPGSDVVEIRDGKGKLVMRISLNEGDANNIPTYIDNLKRLVKAKATDEDYKKVTRQIKDKKEEAEEKSMDAFNINKEDQ